MNSGAFLTLTTMQSKQLFGVLCAGGGAALAGLLLPLGVAPRAQADVATGVHGIPETVPRVSRAEEEEKKKTAAKAVTKAELKDIQTIRRTMSRRDTTPEYKKLGAWHNTLRGEDMVEEMELYLDGNEKSVAGVYRLGCSLCGHRGIIHGGITAMAFDDTFGLCAYSMHVKSRTLENNGSPAAFTANLDINYRKPLPCDQRVVFNAKIDRVEGRKIFMSGYATNEAGDTKYADSTALFIAARKK